jgi:hypothetical protein
VKRCKSEIIDLNLADHSGQLLKLPTINKCTLNSWYIRNRDFCTENVMKFRDAIASLSFSEIYTLNDTNEAYKSFYNTLYMFYDLCFPYIKIKIKAKKRLK